ncbi:hypothetical protein AAFF_G00113570 [Aldrovandia affinis]|uniref:Uncharacterized protein n=1 Tax=Aldrovandia affinis TaxID=143900 RepID=A0AAD7RT61_9TELE|nr:hypothetical protein AAFF_G00113570 [Aldrovandia affinis]
MSTDLRACQEQSRPSQDLRGHGSQTAPPQYRRRQHGAGTATRSSPGVCGDRVRHGVRSHGNQAGPKPREHLAPGLPTSSGYPSRRGAVAGRGAPARSFPRRGEAFCAIDGFSEETGLRQRSRP